MKGVKAGVAAVAALGALDAALTILGVQRGVFVEVNPLLRASLDAHLACFLMLKGGLTCFWAGVMWRTAAHPWVPRLNLGIAGAYGVVVAWSVWHMVA
ncbi:MAG: hypothetical protein HYY16_01105 [Planctomycetes bacterium]|nr:hypothetical protein [Planctomycetota bacterium]